MSRQCPKGCNCGSRVLETREELGVIRRKRRCFDCQHTWNTWEVYDTTFAISRLHKKLAEMRADLDDIYGAVGKLVSKSTVENDTDGNE